MKWENLNYGACPHCYDPLLEMDEAMIIRCGRCRFFIHHDKAVRIIEHRSRPESEVPARTRWQNLHDSRCPVCASMLVPIRGDKDIQKCGNGECRFSILQASVDRILADPTHPANRCRRDDVQSA